MVNGVLQVRDGKLVNDIRAELRKQAEEFQKSTETSLQKQPSNR
jgi:argonaute-like protein implicated in RNA metabolism and viral defense